MWKRDNLNVYLFDRRDIGCYVDGALGEAHLRMRLSDLLCSLPSGNPPCDPKIEAIVKDLTLPETEPENEDAHQIASEAIDDAIDVLSVNTAPGLVWLLEGGDLILTTEEEAGL